MKQMMTDYQDARYAMVNSLLALFTQSMEVVTTVEDLAQMVPLLTADRDAISAIAVERDEKKSSVKNVKPDSRSLLGENAFIYSRKLRALGKRTKIPELINLSSLTVSEIEKMRFNSLSEYADEILAYLKKYLLQLSGQLVTQLDVDEFEAGIEAYKAILANTDVTRDQGIEETGDLEEKFTSMMAKVYIIDDIIDGLRKKYKEFCDTYDVARVVRSYGLRHKTPEEIALLKAKEAERKAAARLAKKQKAETARAEKIKKLQDKLTPETETLSAENSKQNNL